MRFIIALVPLVLVAAPIACGGSESDDAPAPLSLEDIARVDEGAVIVDIVNHPDSIQARYVDAVYDEAGQYAPAGVTARNLILYGLASCEEEPPSLPQEWDQVRGDDRADTFAEAARELAHEQLC